MVSQESLDRIRTIVERAFADNFEGHETDLTLEARVDHYGYDIVDVVFVFDESPPGLGGRKSVDFRGQVDDDMVEQGLLIDTAYQFHLRAELEEALREDSR